MMKTLGHVLFDAMFIEQVKKGDRFEGQSDYIKRQLVAGANAVIAHAIANAEPTLYVHPICLQIPSLAVECSNVRLSDSQIPLFTVPQPLPSVEPSWKPLLEEVRQIKADFDDFDGDRRGISACLYEAEEKLIEALLKGEK